MSNDELELPAKAAAPKKKKGKLIAIVAVVLLLVLGGAGYLFLMPHKGQAKAAEAEPPKAAKELFLPLEPAFVVNFSGDPSVRFLQVGVTLMSHDAKALDAAKEAQPVLRNALVMLFSSQSYAGVGDAAGKQKLQAQALAAVQKIIKQRTGKNGIDALYFTSFVMQ